VAVSARLRLAYLHGFASGPWSFKGRGLAAAFAERGLRLELPDLNRPSFDQLTPSGMLAALDELDRVAPERGARDRNPRDSDGRDRTGLDGTDRGSSGDPTPPRWGFVGSSLGGWVAARWAELHPERVARLLLLAPAFDLPGRWRDLVSPEQLREWERRGWIAAPDGTGREGRLHWEFLLDARRQPPFPSVGCPTLILHGRSDAVVPLASSEAYTRQHPAVRLEVFDDGHELLASLPTVTGRALEWLGDAQPVPADAEAIGRPVARA
jgi:hypothetical protein